MKKLPPYTLLVVALLVIGFTAWATLSRLGGVDQAMISDKYPTSITPAGYVFSIWTLIYASWIAVGIFVLQHHEPRHLIVRAWQRLFGKRESLPLTTNEQGLMSLAMILTAVWLFPWHFDFIGTSVVVMLVLLGVLFALFFRARRAPEWFQLSIELFLGWIVVATIANISVWLVSLGMVTSDSMNWRIFALSVGALLNIWMLVKYRTWVMSAVFLWALAGILF